MVSIIIPVYNDPEGIEKVLPNLVIQSYPNYEILIIDNGSTDNTVDTIRKWEQKYPNLIQLFFENNIQGSDPARNVGIQNAKGDILAFTDADCVPDLNWIEEGIKGLKTQGVNYAGGNIQFSYKDGRPNLYEYYDSGTFLKQKKFIETEGWGATANFFIRRETIDKYGVFRGDLSLQCYYYSSG